MHQFTMDDSVQAWSLHAVRLNSLIKMLLGYEKGRLRAIPLRIKGK